jgi:hypothetical protein
MLRLNQKPHSLYPLYLSSQLSKKIYRERREAYPICLYRTLFGSSHLNFPSYKGQSETGSLLPLHSRQPASTNKKIDDRSTSVQWVLAYPYLHTLPKRKHPCTMSCYPKEPVSCRSKHFPKAPLTSSGISSTLRKMSVDWGETLSRILGRMLTSAEAEEPSLATKVQSLEGCLSARSRRSSKYAFDFR